VHHHPRMTPLPPFLSGRLATVVTDMARFQFLPTTQKALADDALVQRAISLRRRAAALPGGGAIGMAGLPGALFAIAVASRYDAAIAKKVAEMPTWLRVGAGLCFVSGAVATAPQTFHGRN